MGKYSGKKCRLLAMMWLTAFFFFVEIVVGYVTNSMALVADSFHMLGDIAALVISFLSVKMSPKKWSKNTFGWARAEVLGALVNAVFLVALCFSITIEACKRFIEEETIHEPKLLLIVGVLGLLVNVIGLFLLYEHGGHHGHSHGGLTRNHSRINELANVDEEEGDNNSFTYQNQDKSALKKSSHGHSHDPGSMNMREQLIEAIGAKPAIWNIRNEEYRNRVVTSKAWDDVLSEINLNKEYKNKARKRWDSLKSGYGRSKNAPSGSASKPRYKFSHLLSFLDDTREPRCTTSMMTSIESQPKTSCKTNKKDEPSPKNFQIEALKILKDINTPKAEIVKPKSFAALTCDMIQQDMETLPPLEQRALRNRLFEVVDEAVTRHHRRVGN